MKKIGYSIIITALLILFFIPNIAEIYLEQKDIQLIGRELEIGNIDLNYFTGNIALEKVYLMEKAATDTFAGFEILEVNIGIWSSLFGAYTIESVLLEQPFVTVIEMDSLFNYSDLVPLPDTLAVEEPIQELDSVQTEVNYHIGPVQIRGLSARYGKLEQYEIGIDNLNFWLDPFSSSHQVFRGDFSFLFAKGGDLTTSFEVDLSSGQYQSEIKLDSLWLNQFTPVVKDFLKINHLAGYYSNEIVLAGNIKEDDLRLKGKVSLNSLRVIDQYSIEQLAIGELSIGIDSIDLANQHYQFSHIRVNEPYLSYAMYSDTNSFSELLYQEEPIDSMAQVVQDSTAAVALDQTDTVKVRYRIDDFALNGGSVEFMDYTPIHDFHYNINDISVKVDSINDAKAWTVVHLKALLNYAGSVSVKLDIDLNDSKNFAYKANIDSLPLVDLSPYSYQFVAHPVSQGMMYFDGSAKTSKHFLRSDNKILLDQMKLGDKRPHSESIKLPVKVAVGLLKNGKGEIKIKLPIRGNLDDPEFGIWRTVLNTLKNLVIKTVSTPLTIAGKILTINDKEVKEIPYHLLQTSFDDETSKVIRNIGKRIKEHKGHRAIITQQVNPSKEMKVIALQEAKKLYVKTLLNAEKEGKTTSFSSIDSGFQAFINRQVVSDTVMNLSEKCLSIVGKEKVNQRYLEIVSLRNKGFKEIMGGDKNVEVRTGKPSDSKSLRTVFKVVEY